MKCRAPMSRFWGLLTCCLFSVAHALTFEVTGTGGNQIPVAVLDFSGEGKDSLSEVIRADLTRSGVIKMIAAPAGQAPAELAQIPFSALTAAQFAAIGSVTSDGSQITVRYRLVALASQTQLTGLALTLPANQYRKLAHRVADHIYEKLTGDKGVFSTRIAYVLKQGRRYQLQVADADGANPQSVLSSAEPIISPAWSPDGGRLAYVSFESRKPVVYVQNIATGTRQVAANFKGSNSAPAYAPSGDQLAVVLSQDGLSQIYAVGVGGGAAKRLARSGGIDTEPTFTPDGSAIYFTSDRGGSPQIYRMPAVGGSASRVTFEGAYNVSPDVSPDGKSLVYIQNKGGKYQLALLDLASNQTQLLTDSNYDESPSFSPNGKMILYATQVGGRGVLAAVSSDGRVKQRLSDVAGDVREPAWGPY